MLGVNEFGWKIKKCIIAASLKFQVSIWQCQHSCWPYIFKNNIFCQSIYISSTTIYLLTSKYRFYQINNQYILPSLKFLIEIFLYRKIKINTRYYSHNFCLKNFYFRKVPRSKLVEEDLIMKLDERPQYF